METASAAGSGLPLTSMQPPDESAPLTRKSRSYKRGSTDVLSFPLEQVLADCRFVRCSHNPNWMLVRHVLPLTNLLYPDCVPCYAPRRVRNWYCGIRDDHAAQSLSHRMGNQQNWPCVDDGMTLLNAINTPTPEGKRSRYTRTEIFDRSFQCS